MSVAQSLPGIALKFPLSSHTILRASISSNGPNVVLEQSWPINKSKISNIRLNFNDLLQLHQIIQVLYNLNNLCSQPAI